MRPPTHNPLPIPLHTPKERLPQLRHLPLALGHWREPARLVTWRAPLCETDEFVVGVCVDDFEEDGVRLSLHLPGPGVFAEGVAGGGAREKGFVEGGLRVGDVVVGGEEAGCHCRGVGGGSGEELQAWWCHGWGSLRGEVVENWERYGGDVKDVFKVAF